MSSAPVVSSPVAVFSRSTENKSSPVETGDQQAFDQVLSRRIERDDSPRPGQPQPTENSKQSTPADEVVASETQAQQALEAVSPWLQMLAQAAPAPVGIPEVTKEKPLGSDVAQQETDAAQLQLLTAGTALPAPALPVSNPGSGLPAESSGESRLASVTASSLPVAASEVMPTGKELPQASAEVADAGGFADELLAKLSVADDVPVQSSPQSAPAAILTSKPESVGQSVTVRHTVAETVGESRWGDAVAQRVSMMLGRQEQQLEMQLNPPHLGPMEVRLTMGGEQASVVFTSQNAAVREALSAATPRLTALLADQGIQLVNVQVASDSLNQQAQEQARQQAAFGNQSESRQRMTGQFASENIGEQRVLTGVNIPVARSGVSLYV